MFRGFLNQRGTSLIELQIAAVISLIVGGISFFTLIQSHGAYKMGEDMTDLQYRGRKSMDRLVEDIRLAGFGLDIGDTSFISAIENEVTILADVGDDGDIDTIRYYLSETTELNGTANPEDRILYKSVNGSSPGIRVGTSFSSLSLNYFDNSRKSLLDILNSPHKVMTDDLMDIRLITVSLVAEMQNPDSDGQYRSLGLNSSLNPRNPIILANKF